MLAGVLAFGWLSTGTGTAEPPTTPAASTPTGAGTVGSASAGPVAMAAPGLDPHRAAVCRAVVAALPAALPDALPDLARRRVSAGEEQNAAYGDPPITLACGGVAAPSVAPTARVYPLSGVCWYAVERPDAIVWTTLDREIPVEVSVPRRYESPGQWVIVFSAPVAAAMPITTAKPGGC